MNAVSAVVAVLVCLAVSPYLARLTRTVPDRDDRRWYLGAAPSAARLAATAGVAAGLGALAGWAAGWSAQLPAYVTLAALAAPLVVIDLEHHRLPNRLLYPMAVASAVLLVAAAGIGDDWHACLRAAEAAVVVYLVLFALALVSPKALGLGDVRLGAVLAAYLGFHSWPLVYVGLFAGFVLGAVIAVGLLVTRRATRTTAIPFGPMLVLGALLVLALTAPGR